MRFAFTEDQQLFRRSVREVLQRECTPAHLRACWDSETGHSPELWSQLASLGVVGLTVPGSLGGLGMDEVDLVLLLEESGRAALPVPLLETTAVGAPLLAGLRDATLRETWLPRVVAGEAVLSVGLEPAPFVSDAHIADLLLLQRGETLHAVPRERVGLEPQRSIDGARRLFRVRWEASGETCIAEGHEARSLIDQAFDRGALAAAAQLVGLARHMIAVTVDYAKVREQFGKPIGSFQAVKHHLADAHIQVEFAAPAVYRAAWSVARGLQSRALHVSMAKAMASEAANVAARTALQCHGAIGYTYEHDLHLWMKRAWSLAAAWGDASWHRRRAAGFILEGGADFEEESVLD